MGLTLDHLLLSRRLFAMSTCFSLLGTSIAQHGRLDFGVGALGSPYHTTAKSAFAFDPGLVIPSLASSSP
jgi:hypothetical protein